jgi:hypothetical protein
VARRVSVDVRGMHVSGALQPNLGVRIFLVHVRLADRDGDRVLVVTMQKDRIAGRHFDRKHFHILIVKGEMRMRLLVHRDDCRSIGNKRPGRRHSAAK